jgi:hypothetical protein
LNNDQTKSNEINPMVNNLDKIPKVLYKYRSFDSCGYSLQLALHGEAYFASAKDFNDPFDNYFIPTTKMIYLQGEKLDIFLRNKARNHYPDAGESKILELIELGKQRRQMIKDGNPEVFDPVFQVQYRRFGILSLTANPGSLPMWAYYGDSHKGMCIGLSSETIAKHQITLMQQNELLMLHKVNYVTSLPVVNIDIGPSGMTEEELIDLEKTLYTKSKFWKHEDEYRLILKNYSGKPYIFGMEAVTEIILGLEISKEDEALLLEKLVNSKSKAKVMKAIRSKSQYTLEFVDVTW